MKPSRLIPTLLAAAAMLAARHAQAQYDGSVGIQFGNGGANLAPTDYTGLYPQSNWNVVTATSGTLSTLVDGAGVASPVEVNFAATGHGTVSYPLSQTIQKVFSSYLTGMSSMTCSNLPAGTYNVIVYISGPIGASGISLTPGSSVSNPGPSTYYLLPPSSTGPITPLIRGVSTYSPTDTPEPGAPSLNSNYVEFDGIQVTGSGGSFGLSQQPFNYAQIGIYPSGICGIQIVPMPPTVSYGLNFTTSGGNTTFASADSAGAYAIDNWNQASPVATGSCGNLIDNNGYQSSITATWSASSLAAVYSGTGLSTDQELMNAYLTGTGTQGATVNLNNVPVGTYRVIAYVVSGSGCQTGSVTLTTGNAAANTVAALVGPTTTSTGSYTLTNTDYFGQFIPNANPNRVPSSPPAQYYYSTPQVSATIPIVYTEATATSGGGSVPEASYVEFDNVTVMQGVDTITLTQNNSGGNNSGIAGIELIKAQVVTYPMPTETVGGQPIDSSNTALPAPSGDYKAWQVWGSPSFPYSLNEYYPDDAAQYTSYQISVTQVEGTNGIAVAGGAANVPVPVYNGFVNENSTWEDDYDHDVEGGHSVSFVNFASIDTDVPVLVTITLTGTLTQSSVIPTSYYTSPPVAGSLSTSTQATIRPMATAAAFGIPNPYTISGQTISFVVNHWPCQLSIEPNGFNSWNPVLQHPLLLFFNPVDHDAPNPTASNVQVIAPNFYNSGLKITSSAQTLYFPPGFCITPEVETSEGQVCYLAGGSLIEFTPEPTSNYIHFPGSTSGWTEIRGRGIKSTRLVLKCYNQNSGVYPNACYNSDGTFWNSGDCIDGIVNRDTCQPDVPGDSNYQDCMVVANHKLITGRDQTDFLRLAYVQGFECQNCFSLNGENNYGLGAYNGSETPGYMTLENDIAWTEGDGSMGLLANNNGTMEWITFQNCAVIHAGPGGRQVLGFGPGDPAGTTISHWTFRDIAVEEGGSWLPFIQLAISNGGPGSITNTGFRGISLPSTAAGLAIRFDFDGSNQSFNGIDFNNVTVGGVPLTSGSISGTISGNVLTMTGTTSAGMAIETGDDDPTDTGSFTIENSIQMLSPYAAWQDSVFTAPQLANPAISGDTAAPAGDGIPNLLKYALNLSPFTNGSGGLPTPGMITIGGTGYLTLTYTQVISATDLTYTPEVSGNLQTWNSGPAYVGTVSVTNNAGGATQTVVVQDLTPASPGVPRFIHLKASGP